MSDGLSESRKSLEAERKKTLTDVADVDTMIAADDAKRAMLQSRRDFLQAKIDQLTVGIDALRDAESTSPE